MEAQVAHKTECDRRGVFCAPLPHLHRWIKKLRWIDGLTNASDFAGALAATAEFRATIDGG